MGLLVQIDGRKAFLRQGVWVSADGKLEARLNQATEDWIRETGGPPLDDSDPERTVARTLAERFGGRVLLHQPGDAGTSRRMYFERRQLRLPY
ncbi:MAG: hypothetical protein HY822_21065 [Acidobacteria bacterium]|nr:hypothetical protein [Acidobacteriota bacterium]